MLIIFAIVLPIIVHPHSNQTGILGCGFKILQNNEGKLKAKTYSLGCHIRVGDSDNARAGSTGSNLRPLFTGLLCLLIS